ncbi:MAG: hypothetical protein LBB68_06385, partial [Treponema sp.]|nr:hypothetical protein [Treponema sp.]
MKTKYFFNVVMAVFIAVIFSVLTGCATTGKDGGSNGDKGSGSGDAPAPAVQLAADINAIEAGSAEVDGSTVVLSGGVRLETALTVPAGVTLDLTAGGAEIELQDGAVLTVNGAVNARGHSNHGAGWVEGSLRMGDGATAVNGSGTINLTSNGCLLNIGSDQGKSQLTLEGVTLKGRGNSESIANNNALVRVNSGGVLK